MNVSFSLVKCLVKFSIISVICGVSSDSGESTWPQFMFLIGWYSVVEIWNFIKKKKSKWWKHKLHDEKQKKCQRSRWCRFSPASSGIRRRKYFTDHHTPNTIHSFGNSVLACKMHDCYCRICKNFEQHFIPSHSSDASHYNLIVPLTIWHQLFLEFWLVNTWFFAYLREQYAVTCLENVRQLNITRGKKLGFQLSNTQPPIDENKPFQIAFKRI